MDTYSAHQLSFFPWLGFWKKIYSSDYFELSIYDQFTEKTWINYSFIGTGQKKQKWGLKIDKEHYIALNSKIVDINVEPNFVDNLLKEFYKYHSKDKYFYYIYPLLKNWLAQVSEMNKLWLINFTLINLVKEYLNIDTPLVIMPKLTNDSTLDIINCVKSCNCEKYLSGPHGKNYLNENLFLKNNIELEYQKTKNLYEKYPHSIISLLSQYGYNRVIELLKADDDIIE